MSLHCSHIESSVEFVSPRTLDQIYSGSFIGIKLSHRDVYGLYNYTITGTFPPYFLTSPPNSNFVHPRTLTLRLLLCKL